MFPASQICRTGAVLGLSRAVLGTDPLAPCVGSCRMSGSSLGARMSDGSTMGTSCLYSKHDVTVASSKRPPFARLARWRSGLAADQTRSFMIKRFVGRHPAIPTQEPKSSLMRSRSSSAVKGRTDIASPLFGGRAPTSLAHSQALLP